MWQMGDYGVQEKRNSAEFCIENKFLIRLLYKNIKNNQQIKFIMKISVVIPAYNEEKRIEESLRKISGFLSKKSEDYEIIVVNDGSTDKTSGIVKKFDNKKVRLIENKSNNGKGYSVKKGVIAAKYSLVLYSDCDLATPIESLDKFVEYINQGYDIIIGSRNLKKSKIIVHQPIYRQLMGKIFPLLVDIIALTGFKDTQCGFKLYKTKAAKNIVEKQRTNGFSFDVEMLLVAKKMHYKIKEVPITWISKGESKVDIIKDPIKMLVDLIRIKINDIKGLYD